MNSGPTRASLSVSQEAVKDKDLLANLEVFWKGARQAAPDAIGV